MFVTPANAGVQSLPGCLDSGLRRNDVWEHLTDLVHLCVWTYTEVSEQEQSDEAISGLHRGDCFAALAMTKD